MRKNLLHAMCLFISSFFYIVPTHRLLQMLNKRETYSLKKEVSGIIYIDTIRSLFASLFTICCFIQSHLRCSIYRSQYGDNRLILSTINPFRPTDGTFGRKLSRRYRGGCQSDITLRGRCKSTGKHCVEKIRSGTHGAVWISAQHIFQSNYIEAIINRT